MPLIQDSEHKVVEYTVPDAWKLFIVESFFQEEANQRVLVVRVSQGAQALQDAGDAQAIVGVTVSDKQTNRRIKENREVLLL